MIGLSIQGWREAVGSVGAGGKDGLDQVVADQISSSSMSALGGRSLQIIRLLQRA